MSRVNNLLIIGLISNLLLTTGYAAENSNVTPTPATQGIVNYKVLTAPPDINAASEQWLIYFGPTKEQADQDKIAAAKRKYVEKHSPVQSIPIRRVERQVTWIKLTPEQQVTLDRSVNSSDPNKRTQINIYGY